jgi:hypothetical protein
VHVVRVRLTLQSIEKRRSARPNLHFVVSPHSATLPSQGCLSQPSEMDFGHSDHGKASRGRCSWPGNISAFACAIPRFTADRRVATPAIAATCSSMLPYPRLSKGQHGNRGTGRFHRSLGRPGESEAGDAPGNRLLARTVPTARYAWNRGLLGWGQARPAAGLAGDRPAAQKRAGLFAPRSRGVVALSRRSAGGQSGRPLVARHIVGERRC